MTSNNSISLKCDRCQYDCEETELKCLDEFADMFDLVCEQCRKFLLFRIDDIDND